MRGSTSSKVFTGIGAVSAVLAPVGDYYLDELRIHLSAVGASGTLTIKLDSVHGPEYDVLLVSQDMTSIQDLEYKPDPKSHFLQGDTIVVTWANAGGKTYGIEFVSTLIREVF